MRWINNGIKYLRGDYECLIAQFNGIGCWFTLRASATQQTQKSEFKRLANYLDDEITICEVKKMYDDNDNLVEHDIIVFDFYYDGSCHFFVPINGTLSEINM